MTPVEHIPESDRDPEQVIRDAQTEMENAKAAYEAARDTWLELMRAAGHPVHEPKPRWQ
jgi:hypothetical protein